MTHIWLKAGALALLLCGAQACRTNDTARSLEGEWGFALDPADTGAGEGWAARDLTEHLRLPGSLQEQDKGYDVSVSTPWTGYVADRSWYTDSLYAPYRREGNVKVPFWLNPDKHYVGVAWYTRHVDVPAAWEGRRLRFSFERAHWTTTLYIDGREAGRCDALGVPHRYVTPPLEPGRHRLTLRVDNRMHVDVGENAHSVSDHTQSNWNGLVGTLSMEALPAVGIDHVQTYADARTGELRVKVHLDGTVPPGEEARLKLKVMHRSRRVAGCEVAVTDGSGRCVETVMQVEDAALWSEFAPELYTLHTRLETTGGEVSRHETDFGFRRLERDGTRFRLNGQPLFLRGTLECCIFPLTGYPAMDDDYWQKIYTACREHGLNHVRFHSWCPPEAAFRVADRMGIYLQVECGGWTAVGDGQPQDEWLRREGDRILREYGNHPSFCLLAYGNEPGGANQGRYLSDLIDHWRTTDGRRLYTSAGGWPRVENADYFNTDRPRIGGIGRIDNLLNVYEPRTDYDFRDRIEPDMPVVSHEVGQWCVYPDLKETDRYTGVLKAKNFEIFRETLHAHGLADMAEPFLYASGRLQTLCYKMDIEAALRTPGFAGFQLLDLHDFPGQGTALVGVLNPFWESKGYVEAEEFRSFSGRTVPLARMEKLIWNDTASLVADVEFAHFGPQPLTDAPVYWKLTASDGSTVGQGTWRCDLPVGNCLKAGRIRCPLTAVAAPAQLTLEVGIGRTDIANRWHVWVYPHRRTDPPVMPHIARSLDDETLQRLAAGGDVLLLTRGRVAHDRGGDTRVAFSPIFWNTAWTYHVPPHTLGFLCDAGHPVFRAFPNDGHSDFQWKDLAVHCDAMVMDDFPHDFRPLVYVIDDWFRNRKLGVLFEGRVGKGRLMVCSIDLENGLEHRPAASQFRQSVLEYMASPAFAPTQEMDVQTLRRIVE